LGGWRTDIFLDFFQNRIKTKSFSKGGVVFQIYLNGQVGSSHFFNGWLGPVGRWMGGLGFFPPYRPERIRLQL
jgi:hypothetical protein